MPSVTIEVRDPLTGAPVHLLVTKGRKGLRFKQLPAHLFSAASTPRRLAAAMEFSRVAQETYGSKGFVEDLPITPATIRAKMKGYRAPGDGTTERDERQQYLRSLVPTDAVAQLERMVAGPSHVQVTRPVEPGLAELTPPEETPKRIGPIEAPR